VKDSAAPGYIESKHDLLRRMSRVSGQIGGIERMIEEERYCIDVLTQISAAQAALDKVALGLLNDHTRSCLAEGKASERPAQAEELMAAVTRLMRRG
jgi:CsoR family transcriptional regulator, copper-sensing transcriptional repressor